MSDSVEAEWLRLQRQLDFAEGWWFGLVCSDEPDAIKTLRERATEMLRGRAKVVEIRIPATPDELVDTLRWLDIDHGESDLLWVEGTDLAGAWREAWETFLLRGNERRERWRRLQNGGLLLAGPMSMKVLAREAAPDLWTVRSIVLEPHGGSGLSVNKDADIDTVVTLLKSGRYHEATLEVERIATSIPPAQAAILWAMLAEAAQANGDQTAALAHSKRSIDIWPIDFLPATRFDLMANAFDCAMAIGQWAGADRWVQKMHADSPIDAAFAQRAAMVTNAKLGELHIQRADLSAAEGALASSLRIAEELASVEPSSTIAMSDLAESLTLLGNFHRDYGSLQTARELFARALDIARNLANIDKETGQSRRRLYVAIDRLAYAHRLLGAREDARALFAEASEITARARTEDGETPENLRDSSVQLVRLSESEVELRAYDRAEESLRQAISAFKNLLKLVGETPLTLRDLSVAHNRLGRALEAQSRFDEARFAYQDCVSIRRRLLHHFGRTTEALQDLCGTLERLAIVSTKQRGFGEALQFAEEALSLRRELVDQRGETPSTLRALAAALCSVAQLRAVALAPHAARAHYTEAIKVLERLLPNDPSPPTLSNLLTQLRHELAGFEDH